MGAHNDEVENGNKAGKNHGKTVVQKAKVADNQVGGDHTAIKEHGKTDQKGQRLFQHHVLPGQGVGQHGSQQDVKCCADNGIQDCVFQAGPDIRVGKNAPISV